MELFAEPPTWAEHPLEIGQILRRIKQILERQARLSFKLGIVPALSGVVAYLMFAGGAVLAVGGVPGTSVSAHARIAGGIPIGIALIVLGMALATISYGLFEAAAVYAALKANRAEAASVREAYGVALRSVMRLCGLLILRFMVVGLPVILVEAAIFAIGGPAAKAPGAAALIVAMVVFVLTVLAAIAWSIFAMLHYSLAVPVAVAEGVSALAAMKRSGHLMRKGKGRLIVVMLVLYACWMAATMVLELVVGLLGVVAVFAGAALQVPRNVAVGLGVPAVVLVVLGFLVFVMMEYASLAIALAVVYDDQRFRDVQSATLAAPV